MTSYNDKILESGFIQEEPNLPKHKTKSWGLRDPEKLKGLVVHQSLEEYGTVRGNAKYHVGPNHISKDGLPGLSYTIFIERSGRVILANPVECKPYSQGYGGRPGDENAEFLSVCVGGNFSAPGYVGTQTPTTTQMDLLKKTWEHLKDIWGWTNDCIYGHYHFGKAACPGNDLMDFIDSIRPMRFTSAVERQKALQKLGYYKSGVDGKWGPASKAALVEFQEASGLIADGIWSDKTSVAVREAFDSSTSA
jgi:hypothetical protein